MVQGCKPKTLFDQISRRKCRRNAKKNGHLKELLG